jgi:hypothetical protein
MFTGGAQEDTVKQIRVRIVIKKSLQLHQLGPGVIQFDNIHTGR